MNDERPCGHRWYASRPEVETLPVLHVCVEPWHEHPYGVDAGHAVPVHRCSCRATVVGAGATAPDEPAAAPPPAAPWLPGGRWPWDEDAPPAAP